MLPKHLAPLALAANPVDVFVFLTALETNPHVGGFGKSKRCSLGACSLPSCTRTLKLKGPDMEAIPCLALILEAKPKISRPLLSALSVFPSFLFSSQIDFCTCKCGKEHHRTNSGSLPVEE